jgi:hypothetical protein
LEPTIQKLKIQSLKAQMESCRLQNIACAKEYEASSTAEQKEEIAQRWHKAMQEEHFIKLALERLEKQSNGSKAVQ